MPRDDAARVRDITEAASRIRDRVSGLSLEQFAANDTVMRAVLYDLAVIGEAAKGISGDCVSNTHPCRGQTWQACVTS